MPTELYIGFWLLWTVLVLCGLGYVMLKILSVLEDMRRIMRRW